MSRGTSVRELGRSMSSLEYAYWQAVARDQPLPHERIDWAAAQVAHAIWESSRNPEARREPYRLRDFMPFIFPKPELTEEERDARVAEQLLLMFPPKDAHER